MTDDLTAEQRRIAMQAVKGKNTAPEMTVRKILHGLGYRFRLHRKDLPGKPDIVLPRYKMAVFVHGCFWHGHSCKRGGRPSSNVGFWDKKLSRNMERDQENLRKLKAAGWHCLVIWQCEVKNCEAVTRKLATAFQKVSAERPIVAKRCAE